MGFPQSFAPGLYAGGQPSIDDLTALAAEGVRTVINLRAPDEPVGIDEARETARLGLHYVALPVTGPDDLTAATVARFSQALSEARARGDVLIHCGTSNRVGALVALDHAWTRRGARDEALALGRAAGLRGLEPVVARLLVPPASR